MIAENGRSGGTTANGGATKTMTNGGEQPAPPQAPAAAASDNLQPLDETSLIAPANKTVDIRNWGFPGFLTKDEFKVLKEFRNETFLRQSKEFRDAIFAFGYEEDQVYALCRWLRARKFDYQKVLIMVQEAVAQRSKPSEANFYPDPKMALGCEPSIYISQYPQLYTGHALNGAPVFISKPGILNTDGVACVTNLDGILHFHWYAMIHEYSSRLRQKAAQDKDFKRFECICIMDLEGLAVSKVGRDAMNIIKVQSSIDSICFPETLYKFIVINAPSTIGLLWSVIKGWLDPRTAGKVEIYNNRRTKWESRLKELIDVYELPKDYGGKAEDTNVTLVKENKEEGVIRQYTKLLHVKGSAHTPVYELEDGETMELSVMTRSLVEGQFSIQKQSTTPGKSQTIQNVLVQHKGKGLEEEMPTRIPFPRFVRGPIKFKVKAECKSGSFSTTAGIYLVVGKVVNRAFVRKSMMQKEATPPNALGNATQGQGAAGVAGAQSNSQSQQQVQQRRPSDGDLTADTHQLSTADVAMQHDRSPSIVSPSFVATPLQQQRRRQLEPTTTTPAAVTPQPPMMHSSVRTPQPTPASSPLSQRVSHPHHHHTNTTATTPQHDNYAATGTIAHDYYGQQHYTSNISQQPQQQQHLTVGQVILLIVVGMIAIVLHDYWLLWLLQHQKFYSGSSSASGGGPTCPAPTGE